ncbi:NAD(P)H-dependent oxidoreductase [Gorillibacterium timonense]|uniref:NAD(P)H-dependent oxidoreductase n=1 Tax=Gorillibacterium timonense TaxID=1689269 RepID=UPI00071C868B|nr:NAD(P)H-dependent oxidoreductase [Gorillibacterium timonense]
MKTLVIVAHPDLSASRINLAWVNGLKQEASVTVHNLYEAYPDHWIDVEREQQLLDGHDRIVFQYPLFWYSTPPLLKQWFDDVLERGWAFGPGGEHLKNKEIGVAVSTAGTEESYRPEGYNRFLIRDLLKPMEALVVHVDAVYLPPFLLHDSRNVTDEQLVASAAAYLRYLTAARLPEELVP